MAKPQHDTTEDYATLVKSLSRVAESIESLNRKAVREYKPIVENILLSDCRDINHIEQTLDGLLSFCGYDPSLVPYKRLCRHYWKLDPAATTSYVNAYREIWDSE